jgi:hypothetical protein
MTESARRTFWLVTSNRLAIAQPRPDGLVLVLHDTTEFTYQREKSEAIGVTKSINSGRDKAGRLRSHTVCGILMHSSLAVTTEGLPLGLAAVNSGPGKNSKGPLRSRRKSTQREFP